MNSVRVPIDHPGLAKALAQLVGGTLFVEGVEFQPTDADPSACWKTASAKAFSQVHKHGLSATGRPRSATAYTLSIGFLYHMLHGAQWRAKDWRLGGPVGAVFADLLSGAGLWWAYGPITGAVGIGDGLDDWSDFRAGLIKGESVTDPRLFESETDRCTLDYFARLHFRASLVSDWGYEQKSREAGGWWSVFWGPAAVDFGLLAPVLQAFHAMHLRQTAVYESCGCGNSTAAGCGCEKLRPGLRSWSEGAAAVRDEELA